MNPTPVVKKSLTFQELTDEFNKLVPECAVYDTFGDHRECVEVNVLKILTHNDYVTAFAKRGTSNLDTLRLIKDIPKQITKMTCKMYVMEIEPYESYRKYIRINWKKETYSCRDHGMLTRESKDLAKRLLQKIKISTSGDVVDNIINVENEIARNKREKEYAKLFNVKKENVRSYDKDEVGITIPLDPNDPDKELKVNYNITKNEYKIEDAPEMTKEQLDKILEIVKTQ
jgi:hypothetical protein